MNAPPAILWFRDDLRLTDHAALHAAQQSGRAVLPVYILDDAAAGQWTPGAASRWWLHHSLASLQAGLRAVGSGLVLRRGDTVAILADLIQHTGATDVFTGGSADPWARRLDRAAADTLKQAGATLHRMRTTMLFDPNQVRTKTGGSFSVYTPFSNACLALGGPRPPVPTPTALRRYRCAAIRSPGGLGPVAE